MSQPTSGLLQALIGYYRRLQEDPNEGIAELGFSVQKIHFQVVLNSEDSRASFEDIRDRNGKGKPFPKSMLVPGSGGRSGTGMNPFYCWDNTGYTLGRDNKGKPERAAEMFAAFRDLHRSFLPELANDEGFVALCRFLDAWDPAQAESLENWDEAAGMNVVFKLRGHTEYIHQREAVRKVWLRSQSKDDQDGNQKRGISLMTGEEEDLARIHDPIKGVADANTSGAAIVSFNKDAFESYGKSQSYNAPVGTQDAFRYTTALNRLLADNTRRVRIGDATVVFWSDRQEGGEAESVLRQFFVGGASVAVDAEHAATLDRLRGFLAAARQGQHSASIQDSDPPFYILGLSPNKSRLNVRYWLAGTVSQFAKRLLDHAEQLEIVDDNDKPDNRPLTIRRLTEETARDPQKAALDPKEIPPQLAAGITRAIFQGTPYPRALFDAVMRRIRAEADVNRVKAAILKAYFLQRKVAPVSRHLDENHPDPAYHCGRMFSILAFAQEAAIKSLNAGIVRRSMGAAMSTPGLVLPRLLKGAQVGHIPKLKGSVSGFVRDEINNIFFQIRGNLPTALTLTEQGLFALGFYHEEHFLRAAKSALKKGQLHCNERGEWMRSILEVKISDVLARNNIKYIYEIRVASNSDGESWPDFFIRGATRADDIYFEVLGGSPGDAEEYEKRWQSKRKKYEAYGINEAENNGVKGTKGWLIVLDWRDEWDEKLKKFTHYPDDSRVIGLLEPYLPWLRTTEAS